MFLCNAAKGTLCFISADLADKVFIVILKAESVSCPGSSSSSSKPLADNIQTDRQTDSSSAAAEPLALVGPVVAMGTVLSLSPGSGKARAPEQRVKEEEKKKKRHPVLLHALRWKKRLLAARAKRKGGKKVKPDESEHVHTQRDTDSRHRALKAGHRPGPIPVPVPTVPGFNQTQNQNQNQDQDQDQGSLSPPRVVVQASTGELLRCLSDFLCRRCVKLKELSSNQIVLWFRNVDRALLVQGWQDQVFTSPASLVFVYLLCRAAVDEDTSSEQELHAVFLTCLYLSYSYLGSEISYPLKPFLLEASHNASWESSPDASWESSRDDFWERALQLIDRLSTDMLRINAEPHFFTEVFQDLKKEGREREKQEKEREREKEKEKEKEKEREKEREKVKEKQEKENNGGNSIDDLDR
ncbi:cyclin-dependent kinase 5 activator 1-like [Sander lucioperca]|uniref:cyclin-dependent kinase 5 activator 1-like n=1 Tax=Sander lucioperca TaxID=283035 RepID=UPI00125E14CA|nr:cyclin-dependent kinase 5 activator 1-like [Sander lucioperca]